MYYFPLLALFFRALLLNQVVLPQGDSENLEISVVGMTGGAPGIGGGGQVCCSTFCSA